MPIIEFDPSYDAEGLELRVYAHADCAAKYPQDNSARVAEFVQFGARCRYCGEFLAGRYLNVYTTTGFYGGPEEGGWWGSQYEPIGCLRVGDASKVDEVRKFLASYYEGGPKVVIEEESEAAHPQRIPTSYS